MESPEYLTPVKSTASPAYHYPTPPGSQPKIKVAPGNPRINTRTTMPEMREEGSQCTITRSEDSMSAQERRELKTYGIYINEYDEPRMQGPDYVRIWTTHVAAVPQEAFIVGMSPFYNKDVDGNYYEYYKGNMPEIVRRANAFRGFPQLDDEQYNPQGWKQKHAYYRSPEGIRDMEPFQEFIDESAQGLLDREAEEEAEREAEREDIEAFRKAFRNTLGESSTEVSTPASSTVKTKPTSPSPAPRPAFTADTAKGSLRIRIKNAPVLESAASHPAGHSRNTQKKRRRRHRNDGAYKPGREASAEESDDVRPRKRNKKASRM